MPAARERCRSRRTKEAAFTHGDAADPATPALEIVQHLLGRQVHLLAQPLGDDRDVDEFQQFVGVGAQAAAVERGQDAGLAAQFRIMDRGIRLVAVDMQRAAAAEVEQREGWM